MDYINEMNNLVQNLEVFENEEFGPVRATTINNEPWFIGKDVAEILGYKNTSDALSKHVDEEDKMQIAKYDLQNYKDIGTKGAVVINESGLYSLILSSKLPNAKKFKRWVTSDVLPSIRKTGGYIPHDENMSDDEIMARALLVAQKTIEEKSKLLNQAQVTIQTQSDVINELKPHAEYAERVLEDKKTLLTPTQIAKDFGMAGQGLNALLHELGVQYKQNGQWLLYAKYQGKGYTGPYQPDIPNAKPQTRWTQAGKKFIHDILRKNGYKTILENQQEQQRFDFN
ncbi:MAG: phage antirepressor [Romboutsia sp.]|jgi:prophage antirepressor-like protein|nr:MAG TPA: repressor domain protein [Caudoviricetes sp.]